MDSKGDGHRIRGGSFANGPFEPAWVRHNAEYLMLREMQATIRTAMP